MEPLFIEKQPNTLKIVLDKENRNFTFEGRSLPENTVKFFEPVIKWLKEYREDPVSDVVVNMNFIYFNTSSAKLLLEVLRIFETIYKAGNNMKIIWHYMAEDYDIQEAGEEYSTMVTIPFEYIEHPEEDYEEL